MMTTVKLRGGEGGREGGRGGGGGGGGGRRDLKMVTDGSCGSTEAAAVVGVVTPVS